MNWKTTGFTLLEVLMALTVVSISAVCFAQWISGSERYKSQIDGMVDAMGFASGMMENEILNIGTQAERLAGYRKEAGNRGWIVSVNRHPDREFPQMDRIIVELGGETLRQKIRLVHLVRRHS